jgi:hypothetical protein
MAVAPLPTTPDVVTPPRPPGPELLPMTPTGPDVHPSPGTPEEVPQVPAPDVGTPPPEQVPTPPEQVPTPPGPDLVPPPAPSPGGPPVMAAATFVLLAGLALGGWAGAAWAQQAEESPLPPTTPPEVQNDRPPVGAAGSGETLGEELSRSEGVIAPSPEAATNDPGIVQPTPDAGAGTMRVIPPPGSPGGDPAVRPQ